MKQSLVLVFWAYLGLESASVAAAVVENPERNVAIATIAGVLLAALIYMVGQRAMMGLAPASDLANSSAPFALVAGKILGPVAGPLVAGARHAQGAGHARRLGAADGASAAAPPRITACCRRSSRARAPATRRSPGSSPPGLVGNGRSCWSPFHRRSASSSACSAKPRRCSACSLYLGGCAAAIKYRLRGAYDAERHRRRVLHLRHRLVELPRRSRPRRCAWSCSRCSIYRDAPQVPAARPRGARRHRRSCAIGTTTSRLAH